MAELCYNKLRSAGVAHPVERHLAKVEVASSSLVTRSIKVATIVAAFLFLKQERQVQKYLPYFLERPNGLGILCWRNAELFLKLTGEMMYGRIL